MKLISTLYSYAAAGIAQSVQRLATGWTVRGSNPGGGARFSSLVQTGPGAQPAFYTMGTGSFPGVKRLGRDDDHPPPSKRRGQESVPLYLYSPSGPSLPVIGRTLPFFTFLFICYIDTVEKNSTCPNLIF